MRRVATKMFVNVDCFEEYQKRHDDLWPDMEMALKAHGAHNYSIFLDEETGQLFAYVEIEDEARWQALADTEICQKWWAYMEPLMKTNENCSPVAIPLAPVFYLP
ncbi:L-rhamnose mutarotase [Lysinibacillus sp. NPDC097287]|uniref:L-rhamnose mutarotase n=1 Tax=Lysinibacillus sp. NPDC097287 TaxID=3364144 RepID=UPI0038060A18